MNCPDCGAFITNEDLFCGECGRPLVETASPSEPPALDEEQAQPVGGVILAPRSPRPSPAAPQAKKKEIPLTATLVGAGVAILLLCLFAGGFVAWIGSTEPGEPVPKRGALVYEDDFSDPNSGWDTFSEDDTWADYAGEEYAVGVFRENWMAWANPTLELDLANIELQVDARLEKGPLDNNLGPILRSQQDEDGFYWFQISGDGYYSVDMLVGDEWTTLVAWAESDAINQGAGAVNHLKVIAYGNRFIFYVNDTFLVKVTDDTLVSGNIGLAAGAYDEPDVIVHFDNLRVYALEE